jgi:hypothetical protein
VSQHCPVNRSFCGMSRMGNKNGIPMFRPSDYRSHGFPPLVPIKVNHQRPASRKKLLLLPPKKKPANDQFRSFRLSIVIPGRGLSTYNLAIINFPIQGDSNFFRWLKNMNHTFKQSPSSYLPIFQILYLSPFDSAAPNTPYTPEDTFSGPGRIS